MVLRKERVLAATTAKLNRLFTGSDCNRDGRVDREEFRAILKHKDVRMWLASMDYDPKDPEALYNMLDEDGSGQLSCQEFVKGMTKLRGFATAMDLHGSIQMEKEVRQHMSQ